MFGRDAGEWRPDRWLGAGEEKGKEMRRWMWQFGGGGRGCLGQHFATLRTYPLTSLGFVSFNARKKEKTILIAGESHGWETAHR